jgi:leucine dehydrogenase
VAGAANNQLAAPKHAQDLADRGILYAPDFVINTGGVIGAAFEGVGTDGEIDLSAALKATEKVGELLTAVYARAEREGINSHEAAVRLAEDKIRKRREQMRGS